MCAMRKLRRRLPDLAKCHFLAQRWCRLWLVLRKGEPIDQVGSRRLSESRGISPGPLSRPNDRLAMGLEPGYSSDLVPQRQRASPEG